MTTRLGIFSIIAGLILGLFALISKFMGTAPFLSGMTLSTFFEGLADKILDWVSNDTVYNVLYAFFYEIHMAWVLTGLGVTLLVIGVFIRKD